jgi:hypothetical protein
MKFRHHACNFRVVLGGCSIEGKLLPSSLPVTLWAQRIPGDVQWRFGSANTAAWHSIALQWAPAADPLALIARGGPSKREGCAKLR